MKLNALMKNAAWLSLTDAGVDDAARLPAWLRALLKQAQALVLLGARLYVAQVFWLSGLTKIRDWGTTLALFQDEYHVPLLPPELAAYLGTGGELCLPVLLVLGLGGRFAALGLSVMNVMAVLSLEEIAPAALAGHQLWGALLIGLALWGPGRWSLDAWMARRR
ncbi:DoxX family protein [Paucibacter sediminis]|uniref:DoxX family protein n=1 Tax=Paucibacter sediminis TaxID=3019553 RepID=A0AA95SPM5_9BURK|nr:DoxX family protein [Paucibacter sp. S2-9]WIT11001.1 DoxX family protein [Paucibacter sp. S2-9]